MLAARPTVDPADRLPTAAAATRASGRTARMLEVVDAGSRPAPRGDEAKGPRRRGPARPGAREPGTRETSRRPAASTTYRNAALAELKPEELPVAEQLLRGGIPGVRQAIEDQNARARADGRPEVTPGPLLAMAERLLPVVNLATWKDRASVARNAGKDVPLRELRSIVAASSTVNLDDEGRQMAEALRTALDQRVTALREGWVSRITGALDAGRVLDAVKASVRPPEPTARLSAELAVRLSAAASEAMSTGHTGRPVGGPPAGGDRLPCPPHGQAGRAPGRRRRDAPGRGPQGCRLRPRAGPAARHSHPAPTGSPPAGPGPGRRPSPSLLSRTARTPSGTRPGVIRSSARSVQRAVSRVGGTW